MESIQQAFTPKQLDDKEYMIEIWRKLIMSVDDVEVINKIEQIIQETKHKRKAKAE